MVYLPYISDEDLRKAVKKVVDCILSTQQRQEAEMYRNVMDPFSAIFDGAVQGFSLEDWLQKERSRQIQKTIQNQIGDFHENVLSSVPGWKKLKKGVDICNEERQRLAEIKNKYNPVKGSDEVVIYDDLLACLNKPQYHNFTAYYVKIIPKNKESYDKLFTPSDKGTATRRPANEKIRQISGQAFYDLATGTAGALSMLFNILPDVISEVSGLKALDERQKATFRSLFDKAY